VLVPGDRAEPAEATPAARDEPIREVALAAWLWLALLGIALGLILANFSQVRAGELGHPRATWGVTVVVVSGFLGLVAGLRYRLPQYGVALPRWSGPSLAIWGSVLVAILFWAAPSIIFFAGWELPPARPR
jgi:hypothetical protein